MNKTLPDDAMRVAGIAVSDWVTDPDAAHCAMRHIVGADPKEIATRVAFIEKTPRVRVGAFTNLSKDFKNWHSGWKGDDGHCPVARGWCDQHLLSMGYVVPNPLPYDDNML